MDTSDIVAIQQILGLYGHLVDDRDWAGLARVFAEDAVFDASDIKVPVANGLRELQVQFDDPRCMHPLAHHITNPYVWQDADGTVHARSKIVAILVEGRVSSASYLDTLVRTSEGWRIKHRVVTLRRESRMLRQPPEYRRA